MQKMYLSMVLTMLVCAAQAGEVSVENVEVSCQTTCDFAVTLRHADNGWSHYANRWEILSPAGEALATRTLHHPHDDEQPFTRGLNNVVIPDAVNEVLVRGNDSVHGAGPTVRVKINKP